MIPQKSDNERLAVLETQMEALPKIEATLLRIEETLQERHAAAAEARGRMQAEIDHLKHLAHIAIGGCVTAGLGAMVAIIMMVLERVS